MNREQLVTHLVLLGAEGRIDTACHAARSDHWVVVVGGIAMWVIDSTVFNDAKTKPEVHARRDLRQEYEARKPGGFEACFPRVELAAIPEYILALICAYLAELNHEP